MITRYHAEVYLRRMELWQYSTHGTIGNCSVAVQELILTDHSKGYIPYNNASYLWQLHFHVSSCLNSNPPDVSLVRVAYALYLL